MAEVVAETRDRAHMVLYHWPRVHTGMYWQRCGAHWTPICLCIQVDGHILYSELITVNVSQLGEQLEHGVQINGRLWDVARSSGTALCALSAFMTLEWSFVWWWPDGVLTFWTVSIVVDLIVLQRLILIMNGDLLYFKIKLVHWTLLQVLSVFAPCVLFCPPLINLRVWDHFKTWHSICCKKDIDFIGHVANCFGTLEKSSFKRRRVYFGQTISFTVIKILNCVQFNDCSSA